MRDVTFTALFPFGGIGGGALGFKEASARLLGVSARFAIMGGIDSDAAACQDFEKLTGARSLCRDIATMTVDELRAEFGTVAPDVVFMSPPCLPGNGLVVTPEGPQRIDCLRVGGLVLTHRGRYRPIVAIGAHVYAGAIYGFRANGTVDVQEFTAEHPLWVRRNRRPVVGGKQRRKPGPPQFMPASDVRVGDRIGFPIDAEVVGTAAAFVGQRGDPALVAKGGQSSGRYSKPKHLARLSRIVDLSHAAMRPELWFLLGAYLGDGYRRPERNEVIFCVGPSEGALANDVRECLETLGVHGVSEDAHGGRGNVKLRVQAKHLSLLCGQFGDGAERKAIPPQLFGLERPLLDMLVAGYRATDGSARAARHDGKRFRPAHWKIASVSLQLLRDVQRLLLRRGEFGAIHVAWPGGPQTIMGRDVQTKPRWEIRVSEKKRRGTYDFADGAVWVRIREKTERRTTERVWNLEVQEDDTFCAPMMATHNCKGASGLLSAAKSRSAKYRRMNRLALDWTKLMLGAWGDRPPKLVLLENVPRLKKRASHMLRGIRALLRRHGYVFTDGYHDCGELGGLAQYRRRYLLVARHAKSVPPILYQPPKLRVRACGEVLGELPMPGDPSAGPMHVLPKISWLNWVRLALIPAGGDWRDLPGVLAEGQARREQWRRHHVGDWDEPAATVGGPGSNGPENVADPRVHTWGGGQLGVVPWREPAGTVTGAAAPSRGAFSVADPRIKTGYDHAYRVLGWNEPSFTVAGKSHPGCGAYSVADPRVDAVLGCPVDELAVSCNPRSGAWGVIPWNEAAKTITGAAGVDNGPFAIVDPRVPEAPPLMVITDIRKAPPGVPVIVSEDGTWHRPMTTLELGVLQDLPATIDGKPLVLSGNNVSEWRERVGNCVPRRAARAIGSQILVCLVQAELEAFALAPPGCDVWVEPEVAHA